MVCANCHLVETLCLQQPLILANHHLHSQQRCINFPSLPKFYNVGCARLSRNRLRLCGAPVGYWVPRAD
jgi:hypothetical protein